MKSASSSSVRGWAPSASGGQSVFWSRPSQKREIRVHPRAIGTKVCRPQLECVLLVIQIANIQIPVDGVEVLCAEDDAFHQGAAEALQTDA